LQPPPPPPPAAAAESKQEESAPETSAEISPYVSAILASAGALTLTVALVIALVVIIERGNRVAPAEEPAGPAALIPLRPATEASLGIVLKNEAWLSVKIDNKTVFEGRAPQGARQEWRAHRSVQLRLPTPENLDFSLNGAPLRLPRPEPDGSYRIELP
jgi:hypothetical protein